MHLFYDLTLLQFKHLGMFQWTTKVGKGALFNETKYGPLMSARVDTMLKHEVTFLRHLN